MPPLFPAVARSTWLAVGLWIVVAIPAPARAEVSLPNIFGDHMVLQAGQKNRVWGRAAANEAVAVSIAAQMHTVTADSGGNWQVLLDALPPGGPLELTIRGQNEIRYTDVLVGEVWVCSGQSNMQWSVSQSNDADLEHFAGRYPQIRMIHFPQVGSQEPVWSHDRHWQVCAPESVGEFSAVGYFFARQLHMSTQLPIGMINNAWGGSACESWIDRNLLAVDERFTPILDRWSAMEKELAELASRSDLTDAEIQRRDRLTGDMAGNHRPGNIYQGVLSSHIGYGIRGVVWYQGETNAKRAFQYRDLFPLMISNWRKVWNQGDFPFYWVQLADFRAESAEPMESDWAELREAQTRTMARLPHTGEAVIIDLGEGKDIHPKNKVDVARRLARWALANEYGVDVPCHSPQFKSMEIKGRDALLTFEHIGQGWRPFDVPEPRGFAIAGADRKFVWANAKVLEDNRIHVSNDSVPQPVAVRYAWADNPVCNLYSQSGLPLTPFRTDDWPAITAESQ